MQREETEEASDESATRSRASHTVGRPVSSRFFIKEIKDKNVDQFPQDTFLIKEIRVKNGVLWTTVFSTSEASVGSWKPLHIVTFSGNVNCIVCLIVVLLCLPNRPLA